MCALLENGLPVESRIYLKLELYRFICFSIRSKFDTIKLSDFPVEDTPVLFLQKTNFMPRNVNTSANIHQGHRKTQTK